MGFGSIWPWLIVLIIVLLMFGRGRISHLMGDVAKGVKSFRSGLSDDDEEKTERPIEQGKAEPVNQRTEERTNAG